MRVPTDTERLKVSISFDVIAIVCFTVIAVTGIIAVACGGLP